MNLSTPQVQMLNALRRNPISQPVNDRIFGHSKMRTLRSLKKAGLVKVRFWDEPRLRMDEDETWEEWYINESPQTRREGTGVQAPEQNQGKTKG